MQYADRVTDNSNRSTAAMSDYLRDETVVRFTDTGEHGRTSNDFADFLVQSYPNHFEAVPTSQYVKGIDY